MPCLFLIHRLPRSEDKRSQAVRLLKPKTPLLIHSNKAAISRAADASERARARGRERRFRVLKVRAWSRRARSRNGRSRERNLSQRDCQGFASVVGSSSPATNPSSAPAPSNGTLFKPSLSIFHFYSHLSFIDFSPISFVFPFDAAFFTLIIFVCKCPSVFFKFLIKQTCPNWIEDTMVIRELGINNHECLFLSCLWQV